LWRKILARPYAAIIKAPAGSCSRIKGGVYRR
jgi:hypothetical protein